MNNLAKKVSFKLISVNIKSLEGLEVVAFDLYTANGKLICPKGTKLTPGKILQLSYVKLFKKEDEEKKPEEEPKVEKKPEIFDTVPEAPPDFDTKIDQAVTKEVLTSTRSFLKVIEDGKTPDLAVCELTRDKLVEEVASKIEEVDYLGQLRMFDEYTYSHNVNVSALSVALGMKIGLNKHKIKDLALATLLHDIGKMRIPKEVLNKPGKLTDREFEIMKLHTVLGYRIIKDELKLADNIARVALEHQERYSGTGYPKRLKGDDIHEYSQICAIADVYDAICSKRVYKPSRSSKEAIKIMLNEGSRCYNPGLLYKFVQMCSYSAEE